MSTLPDPESKNPTLKIFDPSTTASAGSSRRPKKRSPHIRKVFEKLVLPDLLLRNRSPKTIADVRLAVEDWCKYWSSRQPGEQRILHPLLIGKIRERHLTEYQLHLSQEISTKTGEPLSPATINRKLGGIRQVLRAAERRGLIRRRPQARQLAVRPASKFYLTPEHICQMWRACSRVNWPHVGPIEPAEWWRMALVMYWIYGFRTQELVSFAAGMSSLTMQNVSLAKETPNPAGETRNELGWLTYTPQKQKWAKPTPINVPLTVHSRAVIDRIRKLHRRGVDPAGPLFPWPRAQRDFYRTWYAIQAEAGISSKGGEPFQVKHLRKSAATYLERHHKGLGAAVGGWSERDTDSKVMSVHYQDVEPMLVEQLLCYRVPECFDAILPDPQPRLF